MNISTPELEYRAAMIAVSDAGVQYFRVEGQEFDLLPPGFRSDHRFGRELSLAEASASDRSGCPVEQEDAQIDAIDHPVEVEVGRRVRFTP
jgi:hypothetical protein